MSRIILCFVAIFCVAAAHVVLGDSPATPAQQGNQNYSPSVRPKGFQARITIRTVDEEGNAVSGVAVDAEFPAWNKWKGSTDTNGQFVIEGEAGVFEVFWMVNKDGYYSGRGKFEFQKTLNGSWQPWNPIATQLVRRIVNPIPMYAKKVETKIPAKNTDLGFDLTMGDWVSPYGKGQRSDFIFVFSNRVAGLTDFDGRLWLSFPNALDGIVENKERIAGSLLHLPRTAPEQGYQANWRSYFGRNPKTGCFGDVDVCPGSNPDRSYFVRVQSVSDENGRLRKACYGKIIGQMHIQKLANPMPVLMFTYYLNPTPNDRNMEFDPERNLLQHLTGLEQVHEP